MTLADAHRDPDDRLTQARAEEGGWGLRSELPGGRMRWIVSLGEMGGFGALRRGCIGVRVLKRARCAVNASTPQTVTAWSVDTGQLNFISSTTSGQAACTTARTCTTIGWANGAELAM